METWYLILITLFIFALLKALINVLFSSKKPTHNLPPGPFSFPIVFNFLWNRKPFVELDPILRSLHVKFGPMVTLHFPRPTIFIADRFLAHEALIQNGAIFADRPPAPTANRIATSNQLNISSSFYGPTWRLLRRNLTSEILHPLRVKSYAHARKWVLQILQDRLKSQSKSGDPVRIVDHFQYAMFCLLALMCFGNKLDEKQIKVIEKVVRATILNTGNFTIFNFWPRLTKIVFRKRWEQFLQLRKDQEDVFIPLIRARQKLIQDRVSKAKGDYKNDKDEYAVSYVDTMLDLQLPGEQRRLTEQEMVTLSNEFLVAGTDTTSTALQWIMANLVKYPYIQEKLFMEMKGVVGDTEEEVKEDDLQKMPYLKAIILEGLRRHPPGHFVLPHTVTEEVMLGKYVIPKNVVVNFMIADIGWDPNVWEDPMAFKPERFLNSEKETFDITGSKEIKMMPFGAGRRICPGHGLAMRHLEYFVANLVWKFEWKAVDGDDIDLTEKPEFTVVMKNPLQTRITPRLKVP